jgi:hypothetical protein
MNEYVQTHFGDPCRGCGYSWSLDGDSCRQIIKNAPQDYRHLLRGRDGSEHIARLDWNARAYVAHVVDNTRIWAERVAAVALGSTEAVTPYEEDALGDARGYLGLAILGSLWSLERAVSDWFDSERLVATGAIELIHPEQGPLAYEDVLRRVAHEVYHHRVDIALIISEQP